MEYAAVVTPLIMLVEDHALIAEGLEAHLRQHHFDVVVADGCHRALALLERYTPELIILDAMLDDGLGYDVCATIRAGGPDGIFARHADTPILFLTGRADEEDRLNGFRAGADDYVTKPFNPHELIFRVQALLRRSVGISHGLICHGPLQIDPRRRQVLVGGRVVDLSPKEFDLLHLLASSTGRVFSRGDLLERVWGYAAQNYTRTVDVHVNRVRQKLAACNELCGAMINTEWGVGYKFVPLEPSNLRPARQRPSTVHAWA